MVSKRTLAVVSMVSTLVAVILLARDATQENLAITSHINHDSLGKASPAPRVATAESYKYPIVLTREPKTAWDAFLSGATVNSPPLSVRDCKPPARPQRRLSTDQHQGDITDVGSRRLAAATANDVALENIAGVTIEYKESMGGAPRICVVGPYDRDFDHVAARLRDVNGPGMAYVRYADGELGVATGRQIGNAEWHFPGDGKESVLQNDLLASLKGHWGQEFYYGFASPADDANGLKWFLQHTEQGCAHISYANIWVNSHFEKTKALFKELTEDLYRDRVVLVVNEESVEAAKKLGWAADYLPLPNNIPPMWEDAVFRADMLKKVHDLATKYSGYLFIVSGGPPGKILATKLFEANCRNKVIDMGSSVDPILRNKMTRGYHQEGHPHSKQVDPMWVVPIHEADPVPRAF